MSTSARKRAQRLKSVPDYETRDVSPRFVLSVSLGLFAGMGLSILIVFGILHILAPAAIPAAPALGSQQKGSAPRLEVSPSADRDALQREAQGRLQEYGWTDKAAQTAHIPIDRAIAILTARGWPDPAGNGEGRQ